MYVEQHYVCHTICTSHYHIHTTYCCHLQAYWNVATKRLVDNVCMTIEQDFIVRLLGLAESELFLLAARLENVETLFTEDIAVIEKRRSLQAKRYRLTAGMDSLRR
jgi:Dynamin GTPase effector domain